jgi:hypothetical protein
MLRSWSELAQAKVPENKQDHDDYTDNVKYVVSTHVLPHFSGRTRIPELLLSIVPEAPYARTSYNTRVDAGLLSLSGTLSSPVDEIS